MSSSNNKLSFSILHCTDCDGWVHWGYIVRPDGTEIPQTFATREEAEEEINDFLSEIQQEINDGDRQPDEGYGRDEFEIIEIIENQ